MNAQPNSVDVRIEKDGSCFIDDEYFVCPPDTSVSEAVLAHLRLEAAALDVTLTAVIHDGQAGYEVAIRITPDGTSGPVDGQEAQGVQPPSAQAEFAIGSATSATASSRPHALLPEPFRGRLVEICRTARRDEFAAAGQAADALLTELATLHGPAHPFTLVVGMVRGDIAWLSRNFRAAWPIWSYVARAWSRELGSGHSLTAFGASQAMACWTELPPADAKTEQENVLALLTETAVPGIAAARRHVDRRLALLDEGA